jgi:hypothetical protein
VLTVLPLLAGALLRGGPRDPLLAPWQAAAIALMLLAVAGSLAVSLRPAVLGQEGGPGPGAAT